MGGLPGHAKPRLPGIKGAFRHAVLAAQVGTLRASLMLGQNTDDLFFAISRSLHCPSLRWGGL